MIQVFTTFYNKKEMIQYFSQSCLLIVFYLLSFLPVYSQPGIMTMKETGTGPSSALYSLIASSDNHFYCAGYITDSTPSQTNGHLIKLNEKGEILWEKILDKGHNEKVISIFSDNQGGVFSLMSHSPDSLSPWKNRKTFLIHFDENGNLLSEMAQEKENALFPPVQQLSGGDFLSLVYHKNAADSASNPVPGLVKLNAKGEILWKKSYLPDSGIVSEATFMRLPNEEILFIMAVSFPPDSMDFSKYWKWNQEGIYLIRCKNDGTEISRKYLPPFSKVYIIQPTKDGNFIAAGSKNVDEDSDTEIDIFIRKIAISGETIWEKQIHVQKYDSPMEISELSSGNIILSAYCGGSWVTASAHTALFELSGKGETLWSKVFRDGNCINQLVQKKDSTYFGVGLFSETYVQKEDDSYSFSHDKSFESKSRLYHLSSNQVLWQKHLSTFNSSEQAYCIEKSKDNGFYLSGIDFNGNHIFIRKIDENGNTLWVNSMGTWSASVEVPSGVTELAEGGCIAFNNKDDLYRFSESGEMLWKNKNLDFKHISGIKPHKKNTFFVAGSVWLNYPENNLWWGITGEDGNLISEKEKHFSLPVKVWDIEKCRDEGFLLGCEAGEPGENIIQLVKIDKEGEYEWNELYPMGKSSEARSVAELKSGGYAIGGISYNPQEKYRAVLIKTDSKGKKEWDLKLVKTESELFTSVITVDTAGYILLAATHKFNSYKGEQEIYVTKISEKGEIIWEKFLCGAGSHQVGGIALTHDNHILITGYSSYHQTHKSEPEILLVKVKND